MRLVHMSTFPAGLRFIKGTLHAGVHEHTFQKCDYSFLEHAFVHMSTFSMLPMHCFINEAPDR